ncbi:hypothetical protein NOVA_27420 [Nocardia nova]|uniref:hypothetical protein n=1 Tax=Nocardia nova TaxID=37330 RepID=UPI001C466A24|nr:hypothetical protein [Nocardia nova]MBV7706521.1 hypothetical protein [Nocardia nova]
MNTVITVDFNTTGRRDGSFEDLAKNLGDLYAFYEPNFPEWGGVHFPAMVDYIDYWLGEDFWSDIGQVTHIIGHCAGAAFLPSLAKALECRDIRIGSLIAMDPAVPTLGTIGTQFWQQIDAYRNTLSAREVGEIQAGIQDVVEQGDGIPVSCAKLCKMAADAAAEAYGRLGIGERLLRDYLRELRRYSAYLVAASEVDPCTFLEHVTVVSSDSAVHGTAALRQQHGSIALRGEHRVSSSHEALLKDAAASQIVGELLAAVHR